MGFIFKRQSFLPVELDFAVLNEKVNLDNISARCCQHPFLVVVSRIFRYSPQHKDCLVLNKQVKLLYIITAHLKFENRSRSSTGLSVSVD